MSSSDAQQIEELKKELREVKTKNAKLEKELQQVEDEMKAKNKNLETELDEVKGKNEKLEKELRELKKNHHQQQCVNLPAELKVEIVDCLPVENAAHFLANVPNLLIIHHCAPRVRRMLKMIPQIVAHYARTLPAPDYDGDIDLENGLNYTPEMDIFLRYGAGKCSSFWMSRGFFFGYPVDFFDDLIKHYYQTQLPAEAVRNVNFPLENPAPWPAALLQPGKMTLKKSMVHNESIQYILRNKYNPSITFELYIHFDGNAKCYQQMTNFFVCRV